MYGFNKNAKTYMIYYVTYVFISIIMGILVSSIVGAISFKIGYGEDCPLWFGAEQGWFYGFFFGGVGGLMTMGLGVCYRRLIIVFMWVLGLSIIPAIAGLPVFALFFGIITALGAIPYLIDHRNEFQGHP